MALLTGRVKAVLWGHSDPQDSRCGRELLVLGLLILLERVRQLLKLKTVSLQFQWLTEIVKTVLCLHHLPAGLHPQYCFHFQVNSAIINLLDTWYYKRAVKPPSLALGCGVAFKLGSPSGESETFNHCTTPSSLRLAKQ